MTTNPTSGVAGLFALIEAYAEARHCKGHSSYNAQTAAARKAVKDALDALADQQPQVALKQSQAEPLESLLSTATGLLVGYADGQGVRKPYKPGSAIANFVDECVERLKDWPPRASTPQSLADLEAEQQTKKGTP